MHRLLRGPRTGTGSLRRHRGWHVGWWAMLALALVAAVAVSAMVVRPAAADDRPPGGTLSDPVVRAVDIAGPSIVRIATLFTVHIGINLCGNSLTDSDTVGGLGSGAFVSANGDILTADHVVHIATGEIDAEVIFPALIPVIDKYGACKGFSDAHQATADDVAALAAQGIVTTTYSPPTYDVFRSTGYSGTLDVSGDSQSYLKTLLAVPYLQATVVASSDLLQDDVAVIHVNLTDTPSIQLDDSSSVAVQDKLTIVGFPANADLDPELGGADPNNLVTPSVNSVFVSAIKRNANGSQLIQVGGNVENGDSGGPALDAAGHIVGIVSFFEPNTLPNSTSFLRASNNAKSLFAQANINIQPGPFQQAWQQAFADYAATDAGHWHRAASEFDALSAKYPDFHAVAPYKTYADSAATRETVTSSTLAPSAPLLIGGVIGLGVLLLVIVGILLLVNRRRGSTPTPPPAPTGYSYPPYPGPYSGPYAQPGAPVGSQPPWTSAPVGSGAAREQAPARLERAGSGPTNDPSRPNG